MQIILILLQAENKPKSYCNSSFKSAPGLLLENENLVLFFLAFLGRAPYLGPAKAVFMVFLRFRGNNLVLLYSIGFGTVSDMLHAPLL